MSIHVYVYGMCSNWVCWYDFVGLVHGRIYKTLARHFGHKDKDQSWHGTTRSLGPHQKNHEIFLGFGESQRWDDLKEEGKMGSRLRIR